MNKTWLLLFPSIALCLAITLFSCNNSTTIPFPEKELGYSKPVTEPLVLTASKNLHWDTASRKGINPVTTKLNIEALPAFAYDSSDFKAFSQPPEVTHFDFNSLPEKDFSLDKLPSIPLDFKTSPLGAPYIVNAGKPVMRKDKPLAIYDFGQPQGMQGKLITELFKDHNGLLWIGSPEGLFRYDGQNLQTFVQGSSADPAIIGITEDNQNHIWFIKGATVGRINLHDGTISYSGKIGYSQRGLAKMTKDNKGNIWVYNMLDTAVSIIDPVAETFKNFGVKAGFSVSSPSQFLQVLQDNDGNIWIPTNTGGADIINPAAGKIKYLGKNSGLTSDSLRTIAMDKKGQIWLAMPDGLAAIDVKRGIITHYGQSQGFTHRVPISLYCDAEGQVWNGTLTGFELADINNEKIRFIDQGDGLSGNVITSFVEDNYHRMWVSSTTGLNMIDQYAKTVHPIGTTQIISLMEDAANNLWVATQNGLFIVNPQRTVMHLLDKSTGLSDNFVQSFWKKNGNIIVATNGGFNIIDPVRNTIVKVARKEGLISDSIYVAFADKTGNIWLTGPRSGIDMVDSAKNIILHTDVAGGLSDNTIMDVREDQNGLIWLATNQNGIDVVDPEHGSVRYLNNKPGLKDTCNRMLLEDVHGHMWIGTDKGIYVADMKKGTLTTITKKEGLSDNTILSLLEYNGKIVAGTKNKICIITEPADADAAASWNVSLLDKSQGIFKETNSWSTDAITHDGKYLWGDNGITTINEIKASNDSVATYITGINVMTHPQYFIYDHSSAAKKVSAVGYTEENITWDSVSGAYNIPVNLVMPYNKNYLQFHYAQANLGRPDTTFYTYVLEGIDKNWSAVTTNTYTENYLNLPPGKYAFKVSSREINGKWSTPAVLHFTITPPWYETWWAYTLFGLIGLALLRTYIVYRSRRLQKENKVLEEKVAHRTRQLKQSIEDLKATQSQLIQSEKMASLGELTAGIAHEIQNPLNFVNNFSEVNTELTEELKEELNKTNLPQSEKSTIEKIADDIRQNQEKIIFHGKRADAIVKGMLQHSRSSNSVKEPTNVNVLADEYLRLAYHGLRAKDKSFNAIMETDYDESIGKINVIPQDMGRVILNLITNAFYAVTEKKKQAPPGYQPTVAVSTKRLLHKIEIKVKDNGDGIPQKVMDKIFQPFFTTKPAGQGTGLGLSLSYDIIKAHGGDIKVHTEEGKGTEFTIALPDESDGQKK